MSHVGIQAAAATGLDAGFWTGLAEGDVRISACESCDGWIWPAQPMCPACGSWEVVWKSVDPHGTVYSYTRTHYPFIPDRQDGLPYVVLLVALAEAPSVRILGVYDGPASDEVGIGDEVVGAIRAPSEVTFGLPSLIWKAGGS